MKNANIQKETFYNDKNLLFCYLVDVSTFFLSLQNIHLIV